ncbi:3-hydroxyacyl-CoA dehydrogenase NAD-binding domain-containing protein [Erwinia aphidicola]|uniref:3-hydroxyacyl-CoA dehydrogenase NAD-binding domain-containing protein n=1 Tax=Erwinia aphidicola TaxID=68334 RepID=UPI00300C9F3B
MKNNRQQPRGHMGIALARQGTILIATLDNPPVNAISAAVRTALQALLLQLSHDDEIAALLLLGRGGHFSAGADIREFGQARPPPALRDLCDQLEASDKLVVAAISGNALGGGLELAMAAHYRLALPDARLGLPEIRLGLLPGAGGSQRSVRLTGVKAALDMMLGGDLLSGEQALAIGLVDRLGHNAREDGLTWARELLAAGGEVRRSATTSARAESRESVQAALSAARAKLALQFRGLFSPALIIDCVEAASRSTFAAGCRFEAAQFQRCLFSPQHRALVHIFLAEKRAAKFPLPPGVTPASFSAAGVIGGGTMGAGIAVVMLNAGLQVTLVERDALSLEGGLARIRGYFQRQIAKMRLTPGEVQSRLARLQGTLELSALQPADLVVEAVTEDLAVKQALFRQLAVHCRADALLASNSSYLSITQIAAGTACASHSLGLHFFSPAPVMRLLEVIAPESVPQRNVASAFSLARRLGKIAVRSGICDGFIGNRIMSVTRRAAEAMLVEGASPYEIDSALRGFGFAMGPFETSDLAGGDIGWATRRRRAATRDARERYVSIADRLCEQGWLGQKTGRGWYRYAAGEKNGLPDPEVLAVVEAERCQANIVPRSFSPPEIVRRYLLAMINEGAKVVEEGIARCPGDVDVVMVAGFGFPRYRGGPLFYADTLGLDRVVRDLTRFAEEDPHFWRPAALLLQRAKQGRPISQA